MKKKKKLFLTCSILAASMLTLSSCGTSDNNPDSPSGETSETGNQTDNSSLKLYIDGVEYSSTNNKIEFNYGDEYDINSHLTLKKVNANNQEETITNFTVTTTLTDNSNAGTYLVTITYGNYQAITFNAVIKKIDSIISRFTVDSKIYDALPVAAKYKTSNDSAVKLYYKVIGSDDSTFTETAPKNAGEYECKLVLGDETNYNSVEVETCQFFILKKAIKTIESDGDSVKTFSTGSSQDLDVEGFNSEYMDLYEKVSGEYIKVDKLSNTIGDKEFKVVLNNDNICFENESKREFEYTWTIIDSSIITSVDYNGSTISFNEFISLKSYRPTSCSFTCITGYSASIVDYYDNTSSSLSDTSYSYLRICHGSDVIYKKELLVGYSSVESIKINGKSFDVIDDITYYADSTEENFVVEFVNYTSSLFYETNNSLGTRQVTGNLTLNRENQEITLYQGNSMSYHTICHIKIIVSEPFKSIDLIRYSYKDDKLFTQKITKNYMGNYDAESNDDFAVGLAIELNDDYKDCDVVLIDPETGEEADFSTIFKRIYKNTKNGEHTYLDVELVRDNKVIDGITITIRNDKISLKNENQLYSNRNIYEHVIVVSDGSRTVNFSLNDGFSGKILVNGTENYSKTYQTDGVYREKITYIKELYGKEYRVDYYCTVVVSESTKGFGRLSVDNAHEQYTTKANIYEDSYSTRSNVFDMYFSHYSYVHFDPTTFETDKSGYTVVNAQIVNDENVGCTYIVATINDGTTDHVLYLLLNTDHSFGTSLNPVGNAVVLTSQFNKSQSISFDENNNATITGACSIDDISITFESYVSVKVTNPTGKVQDYGSTDNLDIPIVSAGTYTIVVKNIKNETKTYSIVVDDLIDVLDVTVGNVELEYFSDKNTDFKYESSDYSWNGYLGEGSESLISNGKINVSVAGAMAANTFTDVALTKPFEGSAELEVKEGTNGIKYAEFYCGNSYQSFTVRLLFKEHAVSRAQIITSDYTYDLGNDDDSGDIVDAGMMGSFLFLDSFDYDLYFGNDKLYNDYSYSIFIVSGSELVGFNYNRSLQALEEAGYLFRVTDATTLKTKITKKFDTFGYMYILPEGVSGTITMNNYVTSSDDMVVIVKSNYIFEINIGNNNLFATASIPSMMNLFMNNTVFDSNADDYTLGANNRYTELVYNIGSSEISNISNNKYTINITSGFDFSNFYLDSSHTQPISVNTNNQLELEVKEETNGTKYVEFYYELDDQYAGTSKVKLVFVDNN